MDPLDLADRACPCVDGFVCDESRNVCVRSIDPDAPDADPFAPDADPRAPDADPSAPDANLSARCSGGAAGTVAYSAGFDGDFAADWTAVNGSWGESASELVQTNTNTTITYATADPTNAFVDYRVTSKARLVSGSPTSQIQLSARVQAGVSGEQYHCNWSPNQGDLEIQLSDTDGSDGNPLGNTSVDIGSIAGYDPMAPVVMELQVVGTSIECCVRGLPGASVSVTDTMFSQGAAGAKTFRMSAAFDDFVVETL